MLFIAQSGSARLAMRVETRNNFASSRKMVFIRHDAPLILTSKPAHSFVARSKPFGNLASLDVCSVFSDMTDKLRFRFFGKPSGQKPFYNFPWHVSYSTS